MFAFEEAIGFAFGGLGKDKDGVAAAAVFGELLADVHARGQTLGGHWEDVQRRYGYRQGYRSGYFLADPPSRSLAVFGRLRERCPAAVGGLRVVGVRDLGRGTDTAQPGGRTVLPWQPSDLMLTLTLEGGAAVTLRASGTEAKLKFYIEAAGAAGEAAGPLEQRLSALEAAVIEELVQPELHGLQAKGEA